MTWGKLDDRYDDHPKIKRAWRRSGYAVGLHSQAIAASCRHESDGLVDPEWLADRLAHLPRAAGSAAVKLLVELVLFEELPAGEVRTFADGRGFTVKVGPLNENAHVVHDFLDYNDSSAYLADKRRRDAERKARGRRRDSRPIPRGHRAESSRSPEPEPSDSGAPVPTRPDHPSSPQPPQAGELPASAPSPDRFFAHPPFEPPASPIGKRERDTRRHQAAVARWRASWQAWALSPDAEPTVAEVGLASAVTRHLHETAPGKAAEVGTIHAHGTHDGLLLLGNTGPMAASWLAERLGRMIDDALPAGTRWRIVECGCAATTEAAA